MNIIIIVIIIVIIIIIIIIITIIIIIIIMWRSVLETNLSCFENLTVKPYLIIFTEDFSLNSSIQIVVLYTGGGM